VHGTAVPCLDGPLAVVTSAPRARLGAIAVWGAAVAAHDSDAQANLLATIALTAFLSGRAEQARGYLRDRDKLITDASGFRARASALSLPAIVELAAARPEAARAARA